MAKAKPGFKLKTVYASGHSIVAEGPASDDLLHAVDMLVIYGGIPVNPQWDDETITYHGKVQAFIAMTWKRLKREEAKRKKLLKQEEAKRKGPQK